MYNNACKYFSKKSKYSIVVRICGDEMMHLLTFFKQVRSLISVLYRTKISFWQLWQLTVWQIQTNFQQFSFECNNLSFSEVHDQTRMCENKWKNRRVSIMISIRERFRSGKSQLFSQILTRGTWKDELICGEICVWRRQKSSIDNEFE